jgi:hypothetical protein
MSFLAQVFENHDVWPVHADPWFGQFWKQDNHRLLGNYHAITHVSQVSKERGNESKILALVQTNFHLNSAEHHPFNSPIIST